jgi:ribonuclease P protein component
MTAEADTALPRLRTRPQFQSVLAQPACARTVHFALHRLALDEVLPAPKDATAASDTACPPDGQAVLFPGGGVWLGAMTPKRWARRAVTRNAIRRQIYAQALVEGAPMTSLPQVAWVVRLRAEFSRKHFISASSDALKQAVRAELQQLWSRVRPR